MIDVIIPVKSPNRSNHKDLMYALRSLEKNLKGIGQVYIIGQRITSLKGVKYLNCLDDKKGMYKERNIYRKIMKAVNNDEVSETFCVTNDDILITKPYEVAKLPFYHKGELENTLSNNRGDYRKSLNHTKKFLEAQELPTLDFDTHFPILYNKQKFITTFTHKDVNWEKPFGYVIKSLYANSNKIEGEFGGDCKIHTKMSYEDTKKKIGTKSFFSLSDGCLNTDMIKYLNELYPNKSSYER